MEAAEGQTRWLDMTALAFIGGFCTCVISTKISQTGPYIHEHVFRYLGPAAMEIMLLSMPGSRGGEGVC